MELGYGDVSMNRPYTITKKMWSQYHKSQKNGSINMLLHPLVEYFMEDGVWKQAFEHFEVNDNQEDLVIA